MLSFQIDSGKTSSYNTRPVANLPLPSMKNDFSKIPSSHLTLKNNLDVKIWNSESCGIFKNSFLRFIWPSANSVYNCHNLKGQTSSYPHSILRNSDNSPPGAFYSTLSPLQLGTKE